MKQNPSYSVVIPVYNEEGNVLGLFEEVQKVMSPLGPTEIIFINDGSRDKTLDVLKSIKGITILNLNRNYGQSVALDAGFKVAEGDFIISMDGDRQNDPSDIPKLLEKLEKENLDVVAGWRKYRQDKNGIKLISRTGHLLRKMLIGDVVHDSGCMLRVYRKGAIKTLDICGEMHRYILILLRWKGFRIGEMIVNHRARVNGVSKYNGAKAIRGFVDLVYVWFIYKYSQRPIHLFGYLSLLAFLLSFIFGVQAVLEKIFWAVSLNRNGWFFISMFLFVIGIMFFSFGIVIDLLLKIQLTNSPFEKRYYIREIIKTGNLI